MTVPSTSVVYISDLDGTLLTNAAMLSAFSKTTLTALLREGLPFTVASARGVFSIRMMLEDLPLTLPVVEFNGGFLSDLATGRHEVVHNIAPEVAEDLYHLIHRHRCAPFVSTFSGAEDRVYYGDILNAGMQWYLDDRLQKRDPRWRSTPNLTVALREQVMCLSIIGHTAVLSELEAAIRERHADRVEMHHYENQYSPGWYWLTVHDHRATKDQAIRILRESYGLGDHELVVFGDHNNDIKMFRGADHAIAVANATPELKRHATHVIGTNEEDSVVRYLREDWSRQRAAMGRSSPGTL